jgi:hypothetical protein
MSIKKYIFLNAEKYKKVGDSRRSEELITRAVRKSGNEQDTHH